MRRDKDSFEDFKHLELTREIIGAAIKVHKYYGSGFLEKVYEKALEIELSNRGYTVECQKDIQIFYHSYPTCTYRADMIINDTVLVELKACKSVLPEHKAQVINYLKALEMDIGLLLNFGEEILGKHRLINEQNKGKNI